MLTDLIALFLFISFLVLLIGFIGNLICIRLLCMDTFSESPSSLLNIIKLTIDSFIQLFSSFLLLNYINEVDDLSKTELTCKLSHFGLNVLKSQSSWILTIVCLDSLLSVYLLPKNKKNRLYILLFIVLAIYHMAYNYTSTGKVKLQFNHESNKTKCDYSRGSDIFIWIDFLDSTLLPFIFMSIFTAITTYRILNQISKLKETKFSDYIGPNTTMTLNFMFFLLGLPSTILFFVNFCTYIDPEVEKFLLVFTNTFSHTGNGILIYVISSFDLAFRERLKQLFTNK